MKWDLIRIKALWRSRTRRHKKNKNMAIANRSRVSCAHNTLRALIGLDITPWPWNLGLGSLKVTEDGTIGQFIHDLLLVELFEVKYYRDLEMWVRGHSTVIESGTIWKLRYGFLFTFHSNYGRICSHFGDIQRQRGQRPDLEIWVWGRSRSLKMAPFDRPYATFYWSANCKYSSVLYHFRIISWPWNRG